MMENSHLIARAADYAKKNATNPEVTVEDIAANAGFSYDYFNRIFLMHTGFTVMAYVAHIRMKEAALLLRSTERTLLDIALTVGYDSHEGFLKAFKKIYGCTPSEYRSKNHGKMISYADMTDKAVAAQFLHANPDLILVDADTAIDQLLERNTKRYANFCGKIKYLGLTVAAPDADPERGLVGIGDNRRGESWLELLTDDLDLLAAWLKRFPNVTAFYTGHSPGVIDPILIKCCVSSVFSAAPQAICTNMNPANTMPNSLQIRPLTPGDRDAILQWANGTRNGYVAHLLNADHYADDAVLEYGVFREDALIAVVECAVDEVHGLRINDCCRIRFAEGAASDSLYKAIFSAVVSDVQAKGILPYDDIQYGEYAKNHGNFNSSEFGFEQVGWKYTRTATMR